MIETSTLEKDAILQYHFKKTLEISKKLVYDRVNLKSGCVRFNKSMVTES